MAKTEEKLKICFVIRTIKRGGVEKVLSVIADSLSNYFDVSVLVLTDSEDLEGRVLFNNLNCRFFHNPFFYGYRNLNYKDNNLLQKGIRILKEFTLDISLCIYNISKYILEEHPDKIICLDPWSLAISIMSRILTKSKNIVIYGWFHISIKKTYSTARRWFIDRYFINKSDGIITTCKSMENEIKALCPEVSVVTIYNPITVNYSNTLIGKPKDKTIFLYVGRLDNKQKRLDRLFYALSLIPYENWELHIVGDGPDKNVLMQLSKKININTKIVWHGWSQNPWQVLNRVSAVVLSSDVEGFSLVLAEANYMGIPCISTDCPTGPSEIIENGKNGLIVPLGADEKMNIKAYSMALRNVINNPTKLFDSAQVIRKTSIEKFGLDKIVDQWVKLLNYGSSTFIV